jgi:hypothetical protein
MIIWWLQYGVNESILCTYKQKGFNMIRVKLYDDVEKVAKEIADRMFSGNLTTTVNYLINQGALTEKMIKHREALESRGDDNNE